MRRETEERERRWIERQRRGEGDEDRDRGDEDRDRGERSRRKQRGEGLRDQERINMNRVALVFWYYCFILFSYVCYFMQQFLINWQFLSQLYVSLIMKISYCKDFPIYTQFLESLVNYYFFLHDNFPNYNFKD